MSGYPQILLIVWGLFCGSCLAQQHAVFSWPYGTKAAVSLAYDDTLTSQLDTAIPALNARGLKASFYLQLSSPVLLSRLADWKQAAVQGHELGNHSLFHQCSASMPGREWVSADNNLDTISASQLVQQVRLGNAMLQLIDGRTSRTFTAPCGDLLAAGQAYLPLLHDDFVAIKAGVGGASLSMLQLDPYAVPVTTPVAASGSELIALLQQAALQGGMVNITFHGVGGDYLAVSAAAHAELLDYLQKHRSVYWTDTFINIMQHVKKQQALLKVSDHNPAADSQDATPARQ